MSNLLDELGRQFTIDNEDDNVYFQPFTEVAIRINNKCSSRVLGKLDMDVTTRIINSGPINNTIVLTALLYSHRFHEKALKVSPAFPYYPHSNCESQNFPQEVTSTDLFMMSLLLASKYLHDAGTDDEIHNDEWAELLGVKTSFMNSLEAKYLRFLDWNLFISQEEFQQFVSEIERLVCLHSVEQRHGIMSWLELRTLCQVMEAQGILWQQFLYLLKVFTLIFVTYLVTIGTMYLLFLSGNHELTCSFLSWNVTSYEQRLEDVVMIAAHNQSVACMLLTNRQFGFMEKLHSPYRFSPITTI